MKHSMGKRLIAVLLCLAVFAGSELTGATNLVGDLFAGTTEEPDGGAPLEYNTANISLEDPSDDADIQEGDKSGQETADAEGDTATVISDDIEEKMEMPDGQENENPAIPKKDDSVESVEAAEKEKITQLPETTANRGEADVPENTGDGNSPEPSESSENRDSLQLLENKENKADGSVSENTADNHGAQNSDSSENQTNVENSEKNKEEDEITAPEFDAEFQADGDPVKIYVTAEEGVLPEGTVLSVRPIQEQDVEALEAEEEADPEEVREAKEIQEQFEAVKEELEATVAEDDTKEIAHFLAYDIRFSVENEDGESEEIEPDGDVTVQMEFEEAFLPERIAEEKDVWLDSVDIVHMKETDEGLEAEVLEDAQIGTTPDDRVENAEFTSDSFSVYAIAWIGEVGVYTYKDDKVTISVSEETEGAIPEGTRLRVLPIEASGETGQQYQEVADQLEKKAEDEEYEIAGFLAYDISLIDKEGNEAEPNGEVTVSMDYHGAALPEEIKGQETAGLEHTVMHLEENAEGEVTQVVDLKEKEKVTLLDTTEHQEIQKVEFVTDSFSGYANVWKIPAGKNAEDGVKDAVYIEEFSVIKEETVTGTAPFDEEAGPGNDCSEKDDIVRSFDTVSYTLRFDMDTYEKGDAYDQWRICFAFVLPYCKEQAEFLTSSMTWMDITEGYRYKVVEDKENLIQTLYCSKLMIADKDKDNVVIPGYMTADVSIGVKGLSNGERIQPKIYAWLEGNEVYENGVYDVDLAAQNCPTHNKEELKMTTPDPVTVSASDTAKLNIALTGFSTGNQGKWNFDNGDGNVGNQGLGIIRGALSGLGISVQLYNEPDKGMKGLSYPDGSPISFDLELDTLLETSDKKVDLKGNKDGVAYDFKPLLYAMGETNASGTYKGRNGLEGFGLPYNKYSDRNIGCYDGGSWSVSQNSDGTLTITIKDYKIDGTFPITYPNSGANDKRTIKENIGTISTGRIYFVVPYENRIGDGKEDIVELLGGGKIQINLRDQYLRLNTEPESPEIEQVIQEDDARTWSFQINPPGTFGNCIFFSKRNAHNQIHPLTEACYGDGRDWAYPGMKIGIMAGIFSRNHKGYEGNYLVGYDDFIKFDGDAVELADEYTGFSDNDKKGLLYYTAGTTNRAHLADGRIVDWSKLYNNSEEPGEKQGDNIADYYLVHHGGTVDGDKITHTSLLYAVKSNGKNWNDDEEMRNAKQEDTNLQFFSTLSAANEAGVVVGVLVQVRGDISSLYPRMGVHAVIKDFDEKKLNQTYMLTDTLRFWSRSNLARINQALEEEGKEQVESIPVRTGTSDRYDDVFTSPSNSSSFHPRYHKLTYEEDGRTTGDNPLASGCNGDTVLLVGYTTGVHLDIANSVKGDAGAYIYDLDGGQNVVDFQIRPTVNLAKNVNLSSETEQTTEVTITATLPNGLDYIVGSSYWGGTYISGKKGKQGTIEGGVPIQEGGETSCQYIYLDGDKVQNQAAITIAMVSEKDSEGNTKLTYKMSGVPLQNNSLSEAGYLDMFHFSAAVSDNNSGNKRWTLLTKAAISGTWDQRNQTSKNGNYSEVSTIVNKSSGAGISENVDTRYNELNSEIGWIINYSNNSANEQKNAVLLSVLPHTGFQGTYTLKKWEINLESLNLDSKGFKEKFKLYYTTNPDVRGKDAGDYSYEAITSGEGEWKEVNLSSQKDGTDPAYYGLGDDAFENLKDITAWVLVGDLPEKASIMVHQTIQTEGNAIGNTYQNVASFRLKEGSGLASYAAAYIIGRTITGAVWYDADADGKRNDTERVLSGIKATLFRWNEDQNQYEVCKDKEGQEIPSAITAENGAYSFAGLSAGEYVVAFSGDMSEYDGATVYQANGGTNNGVALGETFSGLGKQNITFPGIEKGTYSYAIAYTLETDNTPGRIVLHDIDAINKNPSMLRQNIELCDHQDLGLVSVKYELPSTGGPGSDFYTLAGMVILLISFGFYEYYRKSRRRKEVA